MYDNDKFNNYWPKAKRRWIVLRLSYNRPQTYVNVIRSLMYPPQRLSLRLRKITLTSVCIHPAYILDNSWYHTWPHPIIVYYSNPKIPLTFLYKLERLRLLTLHQKRLLRYKQRNKVNLGKVVHLSVVNMIFHVPTIQVLTLAQPGESKDSKPECFPLTGSRNMTG